MCASTVDDLAPGMDYIIEVRAYKGQLVGLEQVIDVATKGQKLQPVEALQAVVTKDVGTTVKLSWNQPQSKARKVGFLQIYFEKRGRAELDLLYL